MLLRDWCSVRDIDAWLRCVVVQIGGGNTSTPEK
jgi:hypothetical protein